MKRSIQLPEKEEMHIETQELRHQIEAMIAQARINEVMLNSLFESARRISRLNTLSGLISESFNSYPWSTSDESHIALALFHDKKEIEEILLGEGVELSDIKNLHIYPNEAVISNAEDCKIVDKSGNFKFYKNRTFIGKYSKKKHALLFPGIFNITSLAILPLVRHQKLIGILSISSDRLSRFCEGMATHFMDFYRDVLSIALENAILFSIQNREIYIDQLTGLKNRRFFDLKFEDIIAAQSGRISIYCMVLDIDKFKLINDTYGHLIGDKVLRELAAIIATQVGHKHCTARFGGEEFVVVLSDLKEDEVIEIAERVRAFIEAAEIHIDDGNYIKATISIGISCLDNLIDKEDAKQVLFEQADKALYEAKNNGRNMIVVHKNMIPSFQA